jgi:hypothetical protein
MITGLVVAKRRSVMAAINRRRRPIWPPAPGGARTSVTNKTDDLPADLTAVTGSPAAAPGDLDAAAGTSSAGAVR